MSAQEIDCRGLRCPLPIVELAKAIRRVALGEELTILATDPAFLPDVQAWARMTRNELRELVDGEVKRVRVRRLV